MSESKSIRLARLLDELNELLDDGVVPSTTRSVTINKFADTSDRLISLVHHHQKVLLAEHLEQFPRPAYILTTQPSSMHNDRPCSPTRDGRERVVYVGQKAKTTFDETLANPLQHDLYLMGKEATKYALHKKVVAGGLSHARIKTKTQKQPPEFLYEVVSIPRHRFDLSAEFLALTRCCTWATKKRALLEFGFLPVAAETEGIMECRNLRLNI
jgi:hypothetical protein